MIIDGGREIRKTETGDRKVEHMKNFELLIGIGLGAAIAGAALSCCGKSDRHCKKDDCCRCFADDYPKEYPIPPCRPDGCACLCGTCLSEAFCFPPKREPPRKKDPCKGCYYEKYERKSCR